MLNQVARAIKPHLPLMEAIRAWNEDSEGLAARPGLPSGQLQSYLDDSRTS